MKRRVAPREALVNKRAGFRMVTTALVLLALPVTARGMDKAQLVDLILKDRKAGFESKAAAERAFDAVVDAIREGVQKDGKVQIIGFGVYTVRKTSASTAALAARSATEVLGTKKKVKLHYRSGKNAGVMVAGTNGLYDVLLEVPTGDYLTRPLEVEMKLPKPLSPKIVELTMGLPESDPQLDALLADPGAFPLVVELGLPGWVFDGVPPDPNALDYYGEMFGGFHTDVGVDPCAERLLAERLGLGGVELCPPGDCGLTDPEVAFDALAAVVAAASGSSVELTLDSSATSSSAACGGRTNRQASSIGSSPSTSTIWLSAGSTWSWATRTSAASPRRTSTWNAAGATSTCKSAGSCRS